MPLNQWDEFRDTIFVNRYNLREVIWFSRHSAFLYGSLKEEQGLNCIFLSSLSRCSKSSVIQYSRMFEGYTVERSPQFFCVRILTKIRNPITQGRCFLFVGCHIRIVFASVPLRATRPLTSLLDGFYRMVQSDQYEKCFSWKVNTILKVNSVISKRLPFYIFISFHFFCRAFSSVYMSS